jgi:hypothetical protein
LDTLSEFSILQKLDLTAAENLSGFYVDNGRDPIDKISMLPRLSSSNYPPERLVIRLMRSLFAFMTALHLLDGARLDTVSTHTGTEAQEYSKPESTPRVSMCNGAAVDVND